MVKKSRQKLVKSLQASVEKEITLLSSAILANTQLVDRESEAIGGCTPDDWTEDKHEVDRLAKLTEIRYGHFSLLREVNDFVNNDK